MRKKVMMSVIIGLFVIGLVSASLVTYLSNRAEATVTVESPITSQTSEDMSTWSNAIALSAFGGETKTIYLRTENKANATINGNNENKIASTGTSCDDFTSIKVTIDSTVASVGETELLPNNCINGTDSVELNFGEDSWSPYRLDNTTVKLTFAQNAVGTYVVSGQVQI